MVAPVANMDAQNLVGTSTPSVRTFGLLFGDNLPCPHELAYRFLVTYSKDGAKCREV